MPIVAMYFVIYACIIFISQQSLVRLREFLKKHKTIAGEQVLNKFKSLVRREMYGHLIIITLGIIALLLSTSVPGVYGIWRRGIIHTPIILFGLHSLLHRKFEKRMMTLPAATEDLAQMHRQVVKFWRSGILPKFYFCRLFVSILHRLRRKTSCIIQAL